MTLLIMRILVAIGLVGAAAAALFWFQAIEGDTVLRFAGYEIAMRTSKLIILLATVMIILWIMVAIMRRGVGWLFSYTAWAAARRRRNGLASLSKAMIALAEGDGYRAVREGERAEQLLDNPDLTRLVCAQAARMAGDEQRAEDYFAEMAEDRDTEFLGVMGLLRAALADKKFERALVLAENAHRLRPKKGEVVDILFDLQKRKKDWDGARRTLQAAVKIQRLTRDIGDRRQAILFVAQAMEQDAAGDTENALGSALSALRLAPNLSQAAVSAARLLAAKNEIRLAARRLADAWRAEPHPDIAEVFAALAPDETAPARLKRFDRLFCANPNHPETKVLKAELALLAGDSKLARTALDDVLEARPGARGFALMAAIEQAEGAHEAVVRSWLAKAAGAPRSFHWGCQSCGEAVAQWAPDCPECGAFDSLFWRQGEPDEAAAASMALTMIAPEKQIGAATMAAIDDSEMAEEPDPKTEKDGEDRPKGGALVVAD
jgi:HemY protein